MDPRSSSAGALVPALTLLMAAVAVITTNLWAHNIAMHPCSFLFEIDQWNLKVKKYKNWIYLQPLTINEMKSMGKRWMESWQAYLDCHYYKTNDNKMTMMNQNTKYESEESQRSAINPINAPTLHSVIWPNCPHMLFTLSSLPHVFVHFWKCTHVPGCIHKSWGNTYKF